MSKDSTSVAGEAEVFDITAPKPDLSQMSVPVDVKAGDVPIVMEQLRLTCNKPGQKDWFMTRGAAFHREGMILEADPVEGYGKERYLILGQELMRQFALDLAHVLLVAYITTDGKSGLWPVKLKSQSWRETALQVVKRSEREWVRCITAKDGFMIATAKGVKFPAPEWPDQFPDMSSYILRAFGERIITNVEHPQLKRLGVRED